jgi:hypothetical protein
MDEFGLGGWEEGKRGKDGRDGRGRERRWARDKRRETRDEREMAGGLADGEWRMANGGKGEALGLKGAG